MNKEGLAGMMTRVGNRVSKSAAANVGDLWRAINRADMSQSGKVTFDGADYAIIYSYAEACAEKAGII
jgi:uncharacterized cupredoxin-like copper-binding protein